RARGRTRGGRLRSPSRHAAPGLHRRSCSGCSLLQCGRDDEEPVAALGGGRHDLVAVERWFDLVVAVHALQAEAMARLDRGLTFEGLDAGGVVEDQTELAAVGLELLGGQLDARQARHMGDIDVDGHVAIVLPCRMVATGFEIHLPYLVSGDDYLGNHEYDHAAVLVRLSEYCTTCLCKPL